MKLAKNILDLLFPITCLSCGKEGSLICPDCFSKISIKNSLADNNLIICCDYNNKLVKKMVHSYKYNFVKDLSKPIGNLMTERIKKLSKYIDRDNAVLIPIPLHKKRLKWRGFNQSFLLAQEIGKNLKIPIEDILIREKHTLAQVKIKNAKERENNIKNVFALGQSKNIKNKTIILIDDISTTGATLNECARVLKPLKPKKIRKLVFANG